MRGVMALANAASVDNRAASKPGADVIGAMFEKSSPEKANTLIKTITVH